MGGIREATRQFRIQQWTEIIHDREESGMTIKEYCRKNGIGRYAYFYWAKIIKEEALKELPTQEIVELPVTQNLPAVTVNTSPISSELKLQLGDIQITVTDSTSAALRTRTLEVVRNAV